MLPKTVTGLQALELIADPWLCKGWGLRHLWIGYSGSGKTIANVALADYLKHAGVVTIAVDQKAKVSRYDEATIATEEELDTVEGRSCVVRGFAAKGRLEDSVNFDRLARYVWLLGRSGMQVALIADELSDAQQSEKHFVKTSGRYSWMETLYRQGRECGVSVCAATQLPQEIPRCVYSLSDSVGYFRQEAHEADYYQRLNLLSDDDIATVASLDVHQFLLTRRGDKGRYVGKFNL
jgi:hypothetical protein